MESEERLSSPKKIRLTFDISTGLNDTLGRLAEEAGVTKVEVMRRAIALTEVVAQAKAQGRRVALVDKKGRLTTLVVVL